MNIVKVVIVTILGVASYLFGGLPFTIFVVGSISVASLLWWLTKKFGNRQKEVLVKKKPGAEGKPFLDVRYTPDGVEGAHIGMNNRKEPMQQKEVIDLGAVVPELVTLEIERARARTAEATAETAKACEHIAQSDINPYERSQIIGRLLPTDKTDTTSQRRRKIARKPNPTGNIAGISQHFDI